MADAVRAAEAPETRPRARLSASTPISTGLRGSSSRPSGPDQVGTAIVNYKGDQQSQPADDRPRVFKSNGPGGASSPDDVLRHQQTWKPGSVTSGIFSRPRVRKTRATSHIARSPELYILPVETEKTTARAPQDMRTKKPCRSTNMITHPAARSWRVGRFRAGPVRRRGHVAARHVRKLLFAAGFAMVLSPCSMVGEHGIRKRTRANTRWSSCNCAMHDLFSARR